LTGVRLDQISEKRRDSEFAGAGSKILYNPNIYLLIYIVCGTKMIAVQLIFIQSRGPIYKEF